MTRSSRQMVVVACVTRCSRIFKWLLFRKRRTQKQRRKIEKDFFFSTHSGAKVEVIFLRITAATESRTTRRERWERWGKSKQKSLSVFIILTPLQVYIYTVSVAKSEIIIDSREIAKFIGILLIPRNIFFCVSVLGSRTNDSVRIRRNFAAHKMCSGHNGNNTNRYMQITHSHFVLFIRNVNQTCRRHENSRKAGRQAVCCLYMVKWECRRCCLDTGDSYLVYKIILHTVVGGMFCTRVVDSIV